MEFKRSKLKPLALEVALLKKKAARFGCLFLR
jgi:hypothetical protein